MRCRRGRYNPKRKIIPQEESAGNKTDDLACNCSYGGNPEHKKSPADYNLTPPASPRPGKTLCDGEHPLPKHEAEALLKQGFEKRMVSSQQCNGWPQNVWAVSETGEVYEAQLENREQGVYHGYPVPADDDFRETILKEWNERK